MIGEQPSAGRSAEEDPFARATGYPYPRHPYPVLFDPASGAHPAELVGLGDPGEALLDGLVRPVPVRAATVRSRGQFVAIEDAVVLVAAGSNASPQQLLRKYGGREGTRPMLVMPAEVYGACSVYSAHVTAYGSIAATLHPNPGGTCRLHVLVMPGAELTHMNATESIGTNYVLAAPASVAVDLGPHRIERPLAYVSKRGAVCRDDRPLRVAELAQGGEGMPDATQMEMLETARQLMAREGSVEDFVAAMIADPHYRLAVTGRLAGSALEWCLEASEILAGR